MSLHQLIYNQNPVESEKTSEIGTQKKHKDIVRRAGMQFFFGKNENLQLISMLLRSSKIHHLSWNQIKSPFAYSLNCTNYLKKNFSFSTSHNIILFAPNYVS